MTHPDTHTYDIAYYVTVGKYPNPVTLYGPFPTMQEACTSPEGEDPEAKIMMVTVLGRDI